MKKAHRVIRIENRLIGHKMSVRTKEKATRYKAAIRTEDRFIKT